MNEWFAKIFEDDETLRNIRSGVAATIALSLGALFFGLFNSENLKSLVTYNVAGLTLVAILSVWIWKLDLQDRAMIDELQSNKDLQDIEADILITSKLPRNNDNCMLFADWYNDKEQTFLNKRKTVKRVNKYKDNINRLKLTVRDLKWYQRVVRKIIRFIIYLIPFAHIKDIAYYEKLIHQLKAKPLIDRSYKPIIAKNILSAKIEKDKREEHGATATEYNPKSDGTKKSLIFSFVKFAGIGGTGNMVFAKSASYKTILIYYGLLIASLIWTTASRYPKVRINTKTKYFVTRKNKLDLMRDMIKWNPPVKQDIVLLNKPQDVIMVGEVKE